MSDAQLIAAVLGGRTEAFAVLVRRYQNAYYRFATRMLGSRDDADDALQQAFIRAYRALHTCRDPEHFAAWLYRIVVNECRTFGARRDKREQRMVRGEPETWSPAPESEPPVEEQREFADIQRALCALAEDQREAFVLKHVEELSYEEMATLTGASVSALKMRVKRACARLRQMLEPSRSHT